MSELPSLHHVMIAIPPAGEAAARRFYVDALGLVEIPKPPSLAGRGGVWVSTGTRAVHFGIDPNFVPARKAHIALVVANLDELAIHLISLGFEPGPVEHELPGYRRCYVDDPFGNRVELMQAEYRQSLRESRGHEPGGTSMHAHILSIGAELLHGHITDTNATFLAQELDARGIELLHVTQVGDDRNRIRESIARALTEAEIVICTGGIGPTEDDLTREGIADVVGETPAVDPALREEVESFFLRRGMTMPERNAKQAWLIPSAEALPNPVGTAPGWFVETDGKVIVAMPGVPREMKRMWSEQAAPRIGAQLSGRSYSSVTLKTIGLGESALEEAIVDLVAKTNPIVATYAKDDGVHVRVVGIGDDEETARGIRDEAAAEVTRRLQRWLYGEDDISLAGSIANQLRERGYKIRIVDHGGGGQFAALMLGDTDGALETLSSVARPPDGALPSALAEEAHAGDPRTLGVGISLAASPAGTSFDGVIGVAVAGAISGSQNFPMRSSMVELQRRTMLFTADVIHRLLDGSLD